MDILFLGLNDIGRRVYDWLIAEGESILCLLTDPRQLRQVERLAPDLILCGGFRHIVPKGVLEIPSRGCINLHKAVLPHNRGANPNVWSILEPSPVGVTMHYMDEGIDTGPIIAQKEVEVAFEDTAGSLYGKLEEAQFELFVETWPQIRSGTIVPREQLGKGTVHRKQDFRRLWKIDLEKECRVSETIDLLRALTFPPFNNAYVERDGRKYFLDLKITPEGDADHQENRRLIPDYHG